ncbi:MAG: metallophosphoesterase family protein [Massilia sp.]
MNSTLARGAAALALACSGAQVAAAVDTAPYTVYAAGDIAYCGKAAAAWSGAAATADLVAAGLRANPRAAALALGDLVYQKGTVREFADCYGPTWGRFKQRTYPAPGNHEYATANAAPYFAYFGAVAARGYYSVQLGAWRVISLDSNLAAGPQREQLAWLRRELAQGPRRCTLAYWHHPLYSSGGHGNMPVMRDAWDILYQAGADIVLSGHDHDYERFAPQDANGKLDPARGLRQFVVGTGGAYATPFLLTVKNSEMRDNHRTGVLKLILRDGSYEWEFLEASYSGFPFAQRPDRGTGQCH